MSPRAARCLIVVGWALTACFAVCAALPGRIGADVRGFQAAYLAGFVGYLALVWVITRSTDASNPGKWRWWLIGCIAVRAVLLATPPGDDAYRYVWEGRVQLAGFNPFLHPPDDPSLAELRDADWAKINHRDYPAIYGPVAQAEFLVAAAIHPSVYTIKTLHVVWDLLIVVVLAACLRRGPDPLVGGRRPHGAVLYGLCPLVLTAFGIEGHLDSLMLLAVAIAVWAVLSKRLHLAGVMLGLAIATKIIPIVLLPWFLIRHRRAAVIAVVVAAICYFPYLSAGMGVFASLHRFGTADEFFSMLSAFSVTSFESDAVRWAVLGLLGVILLALARRRDNFTMYGLGATGALLMLTPIVHYWYLSWVLMFTPFRVHLRWLVIALAMVVYFEAQLRRHTTGIWSMPTWAPLVVWGGFAAAWLVELVVPWHALIHGRRR